jgi:hypothetical protein
LFVSVSGVTLPTNFRQLSAAEWAIVDAVFGPTLPLRFRVLISDGIGLYNTPFTVPSSIISAAIITNPVLSLAGIGGLLTTPLRAAAGYASSVTNAGYVMNLGPKYFPDCTISAYAKKLLVHEMTHVWQGSNSVFALSATLASLAAQCSGMSVSGGFSGRSSAYAYTLSSPLAPWGSFNPEQQAIIVEDWYRDGSLSTAAAWPYIRDYVRKGKTS